MIDYEKYAVKKNKTDLLSSLKAMNKEIIDERLKEYDLENIQELKDYITHDFADCLEYAKDDIFTKMYFDKLLQNENSPIICAYEQDIEALWTFVYKKSNYYSYYVADEIKDIIKELNI